MPEEKPEVLEKLDELRERLTKLGVSEEQLPEVQAIILEQTELQADLQAYRDSQFYDDAQVLHYQMSGQRYSKVDIGAKFLRRFAEHIALHAAGQVCLSVDDIVDSIPVMTVRDK